MRSLRVILLLVVSVLLGAVGVAPASAAKPQPATIQITSVVAVDTRTATVTWTPVKGTDHYVLEWAPAMRLYTSATTATITDLYPGDEAGFTVRAETRRNQVLATSSYAYVTLAPEGPASLYGYAPYADTVKLWWSGGYGCYTYELAVAQPDGTYSSVTQLPELRRRPVVAGVPGPGHHGDVRGALCQPLGPLVDLVGAVRGDDRVVLTVPHSAREVGAEAHDVADHDDGRVLDPGARRAVGDVGQRPEGHALVG